MAGRIRIDSDGRRRLWYAPHEVEVLAERLLSDAGLLPTLEAPRVDLERLLEQHFEAEVDYGAAMPLGVLGYTVFGDHIRVCIDRQLTDLATAPTPTVGDVGRWRATIAHEAAHILLHRELFSAGAGGRVPRTFARCSGGTIDGAVEPSDWREVQANMGMAALLMPATVFDSLVTRILLRERRAPIPPVSPGSRLGREIVGAVAREFGVSRQAACIRGRTRGFLLSAG
jgi:hypothetical protein